METNPNLTPDDMAMVQIMVITIDQVKYAFIGPVIHDPRAKHDRQITEIEFGEVLPLGLASRLMNGEFCQSMGLQ
jgi:hypothetical protein